MRWLPLLMVLGCTPTGPAPGSGARPSEEAGAAPSHPSSPAVELGKLQLRDHTVTIEPSPDGPVYTVANTAGTVLLDRGDADAFQRTLPRVFEAYETAFARGDLDARADVTVQADL